MKNTKTNNRYQHIASINILNRRHDLQTVENMRPEETEAIIITPPPHVWDRIEEILNLQQQRHKTANEIISSSFGKRNKLL